MSNNRLYTAIFLLVSAVSIILWRVANEKLLWREFYVTTAFLVICGIVSAILLRDSRKTLP